MPTTPAATAAAAARKSVVASRAVSPQATSNGSGQDTHESDAARPSPAFSPPPRPPETPRYDRDDDGYSRSRIGVIIGGGVLVVLVAVVLMVSLTGSDPKPKPNDFGTSTPAASSAGTGAGPSTAASGSSATARVDRKAVKVAVLNGTTQTGLAREVADRLEKGGFTIPTVGNNSDQQVPQTIVSYNVGNERAARTVAELIKVDASSVQAIDANTSVAADADVVVTVGTDQIG
jgi:hypothetical protein